MSVRSVPVPALETAGVMPVSWARNVEVIGDRVVDRDEALKVPA